MNTKKHIISIISFQNQVLEYNKTIGQRHFYGSNNDHIAYLVKNETLIELICEDQGLTVYRNGEKQKFDYSIGINYPVEKFSLFEKKYWIDTTGRFLYLTPLGKKVACAYWLETLEIELLPDMHGADAIMAGGIIIE